MISDKYKWIFLHIDKNAGSTIERFMVPYSEDTVITTDGKSYFDNVHLLDEEGQIGLKKTRFNGKQTEVTSPLTNSPDYKHWKVRHFEAHLPARFEAYNKFAVVRNPWERCLSGLFLYGGWWPYAHAPERIKTDGNLHSFIAGEVYSEGMTGIRKRTGFTTQCDYLKKSNQRIDEAVVLIRQENLSAELTKLCVDFNIPVKEKTLPNYNKTKDEKIHYSNFYTEETRRLVERIHAEDIERFGYNFDNQAAEEEDFDWGDMKW